MRLIHAYGGVVALGIFSFGVVVPAAATTHKTAVHVTASVAPRTVLMGTPVVVRGTVSPHAAGPVVLERLRGDTWSVVARARSTKAGGYSFTVGTARQHGTWLLKVVRPATSTTQQGTTGSVRVQVATAEYSVRATPRADLVYEGSAIQVDGTVTPVPPSGAHLEWLDHGVWRLADTVVVGSNGVFAGDLSRPVGTWQVRVVEPASATVAAGATAAFTVTVVPQPTP